MPQPPFAALPCSLPSPAGHRLSQYTHAALQVVERAVADLAARYNTNPKDPVVGFG